MVQTKTQSQINYNRHKQNLVINICLFLFSPRTTSRPSSVGRACDCSRSFRNHNVTGSIPVVENLFRFMMEKRGALYIVSTCISTGSVQRNQKHCSSWTFKKNTTEPVLVPNGKKKKLFKNSFLHDYRRIRTYARISQ